MCRGFTRGLKGPAPPCQLWPKSTKNTQKIVFAVLRRTDDPKRRDLLLKLAIQWREEAQGMRQSKPQPNKARVQGEDPDRAALKAQRIRQTSASFT